MSSVFLARELVLGDGFWRRNSSEVSAALRWALEGLRASDNATRLGGALGIGAGADVGIGSELHNEWMYLVSCSKLLTNFLWFQKDSLVAFQVWTGGHGGR